MAHSLSRTKSQVLEYALCNDWNWFGTFTLNPKKYKRDDLDTFIKDLGQFIRDQRKKYQMDIKYLLIPELHKDGKNWHMHGLLSEIPYQDMEPHPLKKLSEKGYISWGSYCQKFGFNSLGPIRDNIKTALYITKYISKNLDNTSIKVNKKMFYSSRGLKKAEKIKEGQLTKPLDFPMAFEGLYSKSTFVDSIDWFKDYFKEFENL
ncbi:rolling circle replication-associated protein [Eubacterium callanderi]|uniref:rolling circle replication-associated protein n=1 Tax=Eubacterium callanderi TaxID=53442 RepID=UPI0022E413C0|nr:hypothetical protein [Eubacterium callanderi]